MFSFTELSFLLWFGPCGWSTNSTWKGRPVILVGPPKPVGTDHQHAVELENVLALELPRRGQVVAPADLAQTAPDRSWVGLKSSTNASLHALDNASCVMTAAYPRWLPPLKGGPSLSIPGIQVAGELRERPAAHHRLAYQTVLEDGSVPTECGVVVVGRAGLQPRLHVLSKAHDGRGPRGRDGLLILQGLHRLQHGPGELQALRVSEVVVVRTRIVRAFSSSSSVLAAVT